ncbi:MAG: SCP2 sterol-binding domain-containing protein [Actinomycetota bacterium]|nr:SCP2 sterol-binding domain-containing protein [Actinomycetota bacterium]
MTEPAEVRPDQFATLVREASDDQLEEGMRENREVLLEEIFRRMPEQLDPARADDVDAVVEWQITRPDGEPDRWQLTIREGRCTAARGAEADPDVSLRVGPVDFVKLITGVENGPKMFVFGRLRIRGNLMLAARMQGWFRMPGR